MILLINNKKIMGNYVNNKLQNIIGWTAVILLVGLSVALLFLPLINSDGIDVISLKKSILEEI